MIYISVNINDLNLNQFQKGLHKIFIEIDDKGIVSRELGFDFDNQIIHAYPSKKYPYGKYGIFDLCIFDLSSIKNSQLTKDMFEKKWEQTFR